MYRNFQKLVWIYFILVLFNLSCSQHMPSSEEDSSIDRHALVNRHTIKITEPDTLGSLSVGNGEFAFNVDASGLQTFPEYYENGISLGTQSQWGWHSVPNTGNYTIEDVAEDFEPCNDLVVPYATQHDEGRAGEATDWLRTNPHRLHLVRQQRLWLAGRCAPAAA